MIEFVYSLFDEYFNKYTQTPIAIYGISKNTEAIISNYDEKYNIVGLMDESRTGDTIYGKSVLSFDDVLANGIKIIIIVARPVNIRLIYRRVAAFCKLNSILVYDIYGKYLSDESHNFDSERTKHIYSQICSERLIKQIEKVDVVSFDVFDTLLMRKVLYPCDIFKIMERQTGLIGFANLRVAAETELFSAPVHPNIYTIYDYIGRHLELNEDRVNELISLEIETEKSCLVLRDSMCKILETAGKLGKQVFLTSDMYLPSNIICEILSSKGIRIDSKNIIVSCDYQISKQGGLFSIIKTKCKTGTRILHIGDNYEADIVSPPKYGIDTFEIKSAINMLEDSCAFELLNYDTTFENRCVIGEFISHMLNDPFVFSSTQGRFNIKSDNDITVFFSALAYRYFSWIAYISKKLQLDRILLSARDSWIFYQMYNHFKHNEDLILMDYFYTSRMCCTLAGIENFEDIQHLVSENYFFNGKLDDLLRKRFLLSDDEITKCTGKENADFILSHGSIILRKAKTVRDNYLTYIKSLGISSNDKVGFVDLGSRNLTCQLNLKKLVPFEMSGLYFTLEKRNVKNTYSMFETNKNTFNIRALGFLTECIITSCEPSVKEFDSLGKPVFCDEPRNEHRIKRLEKMHNDIINHAVNSVLSIYEIINTDLELYDTLFSYINEEYSVIDPSVFDENSPCYAFEDGFCSTVYNIKDTI